MKEFGIKVNMELSKYTEDNKTNKSVCLDF